MTTKKSTADSAEQDLRDAANAFADSVEAARRAGLHVTWPSSPDTLRTLQISAGSRAGVEPPANRMEPVAVEGRVERFEAPTGEDTAAGGAGVDSVKGAKA